MARYKVIKGSESGHCCFEATVVDTEDEQTINQHTWYETVCECFSEEHANKIAAALNA